MNRYSIIRILKCVGYVFAYLVPIAVVFFAMFAAGKMVPHVARTVGLAVTEIGRVANLVGFFAMVAPAFRGDVVVGLLFCFCRSTACTG